MLLTKLRIQFACLEVFICLSDVWDLWSLSRNSPNRQERKGKIRFSFDKYPLCPRNSIYCFVNVPFLWFDSPLFLRGAGPISQIEASLPVNPFIYFCHYFPTSAAAEGFKNVLAWLANHVNLRNVLMKEGRALLLQYVYTCYGERVILLLRNYFGVRRVSESIKLSNYCKLIIKGSMCAV